MCSLCSRLDTEEAITSEWEDRSEDIMQNIAHRNERKGNYERLRGMVNRLSISCV